MNKVDADATLARYHPCPSQGGRGFAWLLDMTDHDEVTAAHLSLAWFTRLYEGENFSRCQMSCDTLLGVTGHIIYNSAALAMADLAALVVTLPDPE